MGIPKRNPIRRSHFHVPRKSKHNWQQIRAEYVEAPSEAARPSLEELAKQHNCSPSYLRERASAENWKLKAEAHLRAIAQSRQAKKIERVATEQATWDDRCSGLADLALEHLQAALAERGLNSKELVELIKALAELHKLGRTLQGESPAAIANPNPEHYNQMSAAELAQMYMDRLKQGRN